MGSVIEEVRALHAPDYRYGYLYCDGCDFCGYEAESPEWPCRTASAVYSADERRDIEEAARLTRKWVDQMSNRNRSLGPRRKSLVQIAYEPMLDFILRSSSLFDSLAKGEPEDTVTFPMVDKISNTVTVSKELLDDSAL